MWESESRNRWDRVGSEGLSVEPESVQPALPLALPFCGSFRLDYSGIALLIMGSFVPWLYYSFYCSPQPRLIYLSIVCVLGISAIIVAQWDRFATPKHRQTRAGGLQDRACPL